MIKLQPIIERLEGKIKGLLYVRGLRALAAIDQVGGLMPGAYVVPAQENAGPNKLQGGHDQKIDVYFDVVLVVGANNSNNAAEVDQIKTLSDAIMEKLTGWVHPDSGQDNVPTEYVSARLLGLQSGAVQWLMRFKTSYRFRKVN
jgi:hypothetical protein